MPGRATPNGWDTGKNFDKTWFTGVEKEMATHSSILAWRIPWMVEPGRL